MTNTAKAMSILISYRTEETYAYPGARPHLMPGCRVFVMRGGDVVETSPFFVRYTAPEALATEIAKRDAWIAERWDGIDNYHQALGLPVGNRDVTRL